MSTTISPKVTASTVTAILVTTILANVTLITPDLFAGLGAYGPLVYGVIIAASGALAGWWKTDPLRDTTKRVTSPDPVVTPDPVRVVHVADASTAPVGVTPVYESTPPV